MLQLLLTGSNPGSAFGASESKLTSQGTGLVALLGAEDGELAGFSAELHALLMQLSPERLQQLDALIAGGRSLPQAASMLLETSAVGGNDDPFARLMQHFAGLRDSTETLALQPPGDAAVATPGRASPLPPAVLPLLQHVADPHNPASAMSSLAASSGAVAVAASGASQPALSPQLAGSLLDMGIPQAVGQRNWGSEVAERVLWMVQGDQQFARLKLNPPQLGPLEVRISVNQDQTQVAFLAQHAAVRDALEAALPRLREMFDAASLQLVRADVADPGAQHGDRAARSDAGSGGGFWGDDGVTEEHAPAEVGSSLAPRGLVDLFA